MSSSTGTNNRRPSTKTNGFRGNRSNSATSMKHRASDRFSSSMNPSSAKSQQNKTTRATGNEAIVSKLQNVISSIRTQRSVEHRNRENAVKKIELC